MPEIHDFEKRTMVAAPIDDPSAIVFLNVYEEGDIWIKIKGCANCSLEKRIMCCGKCPMNTEKGCFFHMDKVGPMNKPFHCVAAPSPKDCQSYCEQEFMCLKGRYEGKIRKVSFPEDVFL